MPDAVEMLRQDHRKVQELFEQFEHSEDSETKKRIVETALTELQVHAALEEEIFYPAVRKEIDEEEKVDEAEEEHHVAKLLISELQKMEPSDDHFDAKFKVLAESVKHHIEEEESEVIPGVEGEIDGAQLGERMAERKEELERKMTNGGSSRKKPELPSKNRRKSGRGSTRRRRR
jgi:hemerythrin superfamily protein